MQKLTQALVLIAAVCVAGSALAKGSTCSDYVAQKKLSGAAKTSFLNKCEKEAVAACEATSAEKKLAGAAKASFEKKCVKDAVGQ